MLDYQHHDFVLLPGADLPRRIVASLQADPARLKGALEGWFESRRSDLDLQSLSLDGLEGEHQGSFELGFRESTWLACRLETATAPHRPRIRFRIEGDRLILSTLPRNAFGERVDEL